MSDQPEQAATPADEPSETATAPAAPPRPAMRVPRHGRGQLLVSGQPGNRGGGRHPWKLVEQCVTVLGLALDEFERRCSDPAYLATLSVDELRLVWAALSPYVLPRKYEHAGVDGGPIALEIDAVRNATVAAFRERLDRHRALHPPASEPAPAAPDREHSPVATVPL